MPQATAKPRAKTAIAAGIAHAGRGMTPPLNLLRPAEIVARRRIYSKSVSKYNDQPVGSSGTGVP
jgi:hypothetical protein